MKRLLSGVAAVTVLALAAAASAQAPLSPSGAVNTRQPPSITFPSAPPAPPPGAATQPAAEAPIPAPIPTPTETASKPPAAPPSAAPAEQATSSTAVAPPESERNAAVARPKRPVRGAEGEGSRETRSAASRAQRYPGDDVANMLNARELNSLDGGAGPVPVPVARPMGPPGYYPRPPMYGPPAGYPPVYGPPPGYPPYPPPPPIMRAPY